jgi:hypothetical protein
MKGQGGVSYYFQALRPMNVRPNSPTTIDRIPPINSHMDRSVGLPEKNRETSELKESMAFKPNTTRTIPATTNRIDIMLFMSVLRLNLVAYPLTGFIESLFG